MSRWCVVCEEMPGEGSDRQPYLLAIHGPFSTREKAEAWAAQEPHGEDVRHEVVQLFGPDEVEL